MNRLDNCGVVQDASLNVDEFRTMLGRRVDGRATPDTEVARYRRTALTRLCEFTKACGLDFEARSD